MSQLDDEMSWDQEDRQERADERAADAVEFGRAAEVSELKALLAEYSQDRRRSWQFVLGSVVAMAVAVIATALAFSHFSSEQSDQSDDIEHLETLAANTNEIAANVEKELGILERVTGEDATNAAQAAQQLVVDTLVLRVDCNQRHALEEALNDVISGLEESGTIPRGSITIDVTEGCKTAMTTGG